MKSSIFISHISEEKAVAVKIKSLLRNAFGKDLGVFVSSDYRSIPGGVKWFDEITESVKNAKIVLVLLSPNSIDRRWINFEAGIGFGSEAKVIPLVFRSLEKSEIGLPLSQLQARSLQDPADVMGFIDDVASQISSSKRVIDAEIFVEEFEEIVRSLPTYGIVLSPYLDYGNPRGITLKFRLINEGNRDAELLQVWAEFPEYLKQRNWSVHPVPPALHIARSTIAAKPYVRKTLRAGILADKTVYYRTDFEYLPNVLSTSMFPYEVKELNYFMKLELTREDSDEVVRFGVDAKGSSSKSELALGQIDGYRP